ncbi:MAG: ABC transporter ATP-binding protein [Synergistetes bacterium]|nr:ABC transporter ATP-binding protein [Synergistota bacterium]
MLKVTDLEVSYGEIKAVRGVSFDVKDGGLVVIIGANGAGKTTLLRAVMGLKKPSSGRILFDGKDITNLKAYQRAALGIVLVPEGGRVFPRLSVKDNLMLGAYLIRDKSAIDKTFEEVCEIFPRLKERLQQTAGTLSGGERQMLAIGRALMSRPSILMVDEISLGLMPKLVDKVFEVVKYLNSKGLTILMSEQNASKSLEIATYGYVIELGRVVHQGSPVELSALEDVKRAYLGG